MYRASFHKLRVRFAEMEIRQNDVAKVAGIAPSTMSSRMSGKHPWTSTEIQRIAAALDIPADQIGAYFFEDAPKGRKAG